MISECAPPGLIMAIESMKKLGACNTPSSNSIAMYDTSRKVEGTPSNLGSMVDSIEVPEEVLPHIPYDNGFGDFCFGRWATRPGRLLHDLAYWQAGSNGAKVIELDGFQRKGAFPFMKLPNHIRRYIYQLILGPLYKYSETGKKSYICLQIVESESAPDIRFDHGYDFFIEFLTNQKGLQNCCHCFHPGVKLREFEKLKAEHDHQYAPHPTRKGGYDLELFPRREFDRTKHVHRAHRDKFDYLYLEWLRGLSNANGYLRKELMEVFWERVAISTTGLMSDEFVKEKTQEMVFISPMSKARPKTNPGIKYIHMDLNIYDLLWKSQDIARDLPLTMLQDFKDFCTFTSKNLKLDKFTLNLGFSTDDIDVLMTEEVVSRSLAATRELQVSENFTMEVKELYMDDEKFENLIDPELEEIETAMKKKYNEFLMEWMKPETLRRKDPETDEEKYLKGRPVTEARVTPPSSPAPCSELYEHEWP